MKTRKIKVIAGTLAVVALFASCKLLKGTGVLNSAPNGNTTNANTDDDDDDSGSGGGGSGDGNSGGSGGGSGAGGYDPSATVVSYGSLTQFNTSRPYDIKVTWLSGAKYVVISRDMASGGSLKAWIADVSGTSVTFGAKQSIDDNCSSCRMASVAPLSSTRFAVAYPDTNDSDHGVARTCDVSGTTITCNSKVVFVTNSISTGNTSIAALASDKFAISYLDNSTAGRAIIATVAGNGTLTYGAATAFDNGMMMVLNTAAPISSTQFVVTYEDGSDMHGKAVVGTVSGTSITFSNEFEFLNAAASMGIAATQLSSSKFVVAYVKQNGSGGAKIGTVSGTAGTASITYGAEAAFSDNIEQDISVSALAADKFVVSYTNNNMFNYGGLGAVATIGKVAASTITYGFGYVFQTYSGSKPQYAAVAAHKDDTFLTMVCGLDTNKGAAYVGAVSP